MKKIMIVDDQAQVRRLVEVTISSEDFSVIQCDNGETAVALARAERPDLILMDIMMPGTVDGLEATRRIKAAPETKACKVIMLTAKGQVVDQEQGYEAGADAYFIKPFSPLELIQKIETTLS
jgi:DNA-binding response OmpR family regulator